MAQVYCERLRNSYIPLVLLMSTAFAAIAPAEDTRLRIADVSERPVLLEKAEPRYPAEARSKGVRSATVQMAIVITTEGRVTEVRVVNPVGLGFDEEAWQAVMQWRFRPAKKNGVAVPVRARVGVNFKMNGTSASRVI